MSKKKIITIIVIVVLFLIAIISIILGIYFNKLSKSNYIVGVGIDRINNKINSYLNYDDKYNIGDSFNIESNITFDLDSEEYLKKSKTDKIALEKYNFIKNLNNLDTNIVFKQDKKKKEALLGIKGDLKTGNLFDFKYLISNATEYYYLEGASKTYINNGTSNYFEMFDEESSLADNVDYIHSFIVSSLKNNLKEKYFERYIVNENINGKSMNVNQISLRLDDKRLHNIFNGILKDLKEDEKSNKILSSYNDDFKKIKIKDNETILEKNESYTVNIYTSKYLYKILKYEIVHLNGDNKESFIYEGDSSKGNIYYVSNDKVLYEIETSFSDSSNEFKILDSSNKEIGNLKIEKDDKGIYYTVNYDDNNTKYDIIYSSKYSNYKENKSYDNKRQLSFKYINNKVSVLSGTITIDSKVSNKVNINEDVSNAVLSSTVNDQTKKNFTDKIPKVIERLKK